MRKEKNEGMSKLEANVKILKIMCNSNIVNINYYIKGPTQIQKKTI